MKPHHILDHLGDGAKHLLDFISISVAVGTLVSLLPSLAALLTIIWTGLRIYDWVEARWENRPPVQD
jgi:hypothetical protein